jgi:hypothetical protein
MTGWDYMRVGWKHMVADRPVTKPAAPDTKVKGAARKQA